MAATLLAKVNRGARLLDSRFPDWRSKVNPRTLAMDSTLFCVLGQVTGDYITGLRVISEPGPIIDSATYGFTLRSTRDANDPRWERLDALWRAQIKRAQ